MTLPMQSRMDLLVQGNRRTWFVLRRMHRGADRRGTDRGRVQDRRSMGLAQDRIQIFCKHPVQRATLLHRQRRLRKQVLSLLSTSVSMNICAKPVWGSAHCYELQCRLVLSVMAIRTVKPGEQSELTHRRASESQVLQKAKRLEGQTVEI